ncbi:MAG: aminodeoxychorismate/anthranilate synthase component II [Desulfatibacillum sp.]|nr:aminodeoxychorismate/anthranilate synthase component II [Desulfatibacillum sp.]
MRLIMIDNYDSFTFNLVQLFYEFGIQVEVYRHDETTLPHIEQRNPDAICISPGPKTPTHAGISKDVVRHFGPRIPILGVCLGMQVINEVFGGRTPKAPVCVHGKCSMVSHKGLGVFKGLPSPFRAARYHSLCVDVVSPLLEITAISDDDVVMGIRHRIYPIHGVQFHMESFMTEYGLEMAANFLELAHPRMELPPPGPDRYPHTQGDVHVFA